MAVRLLQHAADAGDMLDRKAEHHKIHPCLTHNVVFLKVMLYSLATKKTQLQLLLASLLHVPPTSLSLIHI